MKTALNADYQGVLVEMSIPAEPFHSVDGRPCAQVGSAVPIHCCSPEEVKERSTLTHHYAGIFAGDTLAPLGDVLYVRVDDHLAEEVKINHSTYMLVTSSDGVLAQWRCAPTFHSDNQYIAGTPAVSASGRLASLLTARRGQDYALVNIQGLGGYFETPSPWQYVAGAPGLLYASCVLPTREALRDHVARLPPGFSSSNGTVSLRPVLHLGASPRVTLVAENGRQVSHTILDSKTIVDVQYL